MRALECLRTQQQGKQGLKQYREEMGSSTEQEGHSLRNQWTLLTIKTEKRKKCKPTCWQAFRLKVIRVAGSLRVFAKTYSSSPCFWGNEREHHQHTLLRKAEKEGQRGRGQAVSTSARTEIQGWCTAAEMNSAAHWSQTPSLSLSTSYCTEAYAHTPALLAAIFNHLMQRSTA